MLLMISEPTTLSQACTDIHWLHAMQRELHALENNQTWVLTSLPKGKKPISCKWVYQIKYEPNGQVKRYKARLLAESYNQIEGLDYQDNFSPVTKIVTVKIFMVLATLKQ